MEPVKSLLPELLWGAAKDYWSAQGGAVLVISFIGAVLAGDMPTSIKWPAIKAKWNSLKIGAKPVLIALGIGYAYFFWNGTYVRLCEALERVAKLEAQLQKKVGPSVALRARANDVADDLFTFIHHQEKMCPNWNNTECTNRAAAEYETSYQKRVKTVADQLIRNGAMRSYDVNSFCFHDVPRWVRSCAENIRAGAKNVTDTP